MTGSRGTGARWWASLAGLLLFASCTPDHAPPRIRPNDNQQAAGRLSGTTLTLALEARVGAWWPDSSWRQAPLLMAAFGLRGKAPTIPGPMIRVRTGTTLKVAVTNRLDSTLIVHGLQSRPSASDDTIQVLPGATRTVTFAAGAPGTYYYWGATSATTIEQRLGDDSQLLGALIVDPAEGPVAPDRVFVISLYGPPQLTPQDPLTPFAIAFNGRSWPFTERLAVKVGEPVRWRFINASGDNHPMHLHGFYYRVDSRGTMLQDTTYAPADQRQVVTERLGEGTTMATTWTAERPGHWLMHCHIHFHAASDSLWGPNRPMPTAHAGMDRDLMADMTGLVLGITATASDSAVVAPAATPRRLRLEIEPSSVVPQIRIGLSGDSVTPSPASTPGPPLILTRDEPAEITVVNRLAEPTAIHWHGIELESYYDGVPGWSGAPPRIAPMIAPGDSFVARMTPPRAGTFIYHAHNLTTHQVGDGLVGALLVLEPLEVRRASDEITWIITGNDLFQTGFLEINSRRNPAPLILKAKHRYRVRLINITEDNTADITLGDAGALARWRPLAKDAIPVSPGKMVLVPARVRTSVGETYDYEFDTGTRGKLALEVRNDGKLMVSQVVEVR